MKSVTKLKDDARKHEQKEEWDKAIQAYLLVLKTGEEGEGELDLPLYNRVGDLYLRLSKPNDAVTYYVQAADRYAEAGLYNNAIALCNKAMRYVPQRLELLRKLGQFSASQGFLTDARRYFLEFAEKKFAAGQVDEALTALEEFADASGDEEVREMLARQLHAHGRTDEAVDELKKAHALRTKNGDHAGADALREEIESLAPGSMDATASTAVPSTPAAPAFDAPAAPTVKEEDYGFEIALPGEPAEESPQGFESTHFDTAAPEESGDFQIQGFETTHADAEVQDEGSFQLPDFETTAHEDASAITSDDLGLESAVFEAPSEIDTTALPDLEFDESSFGAAEEEDEPDGDSGAFDLPLLGEEDGDGTGALAIDGETGDGESFDLPSFDIDQPTDDEHHDDGGFELPMLSDAEDEEDEEDAEDADAGDDAFAGMDLPMLVDDSASTDSLDTADVEQEQPYVDDRDLDDFGGFSSGTVGSASVEDEPMAEEDAFISDLIASAPPSDPFALLPANPRDQADADADVTADGAGEAGEAAAASGGGGWDPSDLGEAPPKAEAPPAAPSKGKAKDGTDYIDLGSFLTEDDDEDAGTRFRVQEKAPTGDEDRDFAELLSQFKQKVSENVSAEDSAAHYDLGLAFKEMGLVDEAIGEFQIAMRAGDMRLRVYEELGQCFLLKEQFNIAEKVLMRALEMQKDDELEMIGVYYHLGRAYEGLGNRDAARDAFERVLGLDINFQDVTARLKRL